MRGQGRAAGQDALLPLPADHMSELVRPQGVVLPRPRVDGQPTTSLRIRPFNLQCGLGNRRLSRPLSVTDSMSQARPIPVRDTVRWALRTAARRHNGAQYQDSPCIDVSY